MLVLTLAFHTYIAYYISKSKKGFENNIKQIKISPIKLHEEEKLDEKVQVVNCIMADESPDQATLDVLRFI